MSPEKDGGRSIRGAKIITTAEVSETSLTVNVKILIESNAGDVWKFLKSTITYQTGKCLVQHTVYLLLLCTFCSKPDQNAFVQWQLLLNNLYYFVCILLSWQTNHAQWFICIIIWIMCHIWSWLHSMVITSLHVFMTWYSCCNFCMWQMHVVVFQCLFCCMSDEATMLRCRK